MTLSHSLFDDGDHPVRIGAIEPSHEFYQISNRPALLFILAPLLEKEPAENTTFAKELADKKFEPTTVFTEKKKKDLNRKRKRKSGLQIDIYDKNGERRAWQYPVT